MGNKHSAENVCYLLSELGVWRKQAPMIEERFMPSMVKTKTESEIWVAGGEDSTGTTNSFKCIPNQ